MILRNKTKSIVLLEKIDYTKNRWQRMKGLIGKGSYQNRALVIQPCNQVHTWFMRFSIDVLFIDIDNRVIAKELELKPWSISLKLPKSVAVIEAMAGTFSDGEVSIGDVIEFEKVNNDGCDNRIHTKK